jgi:hypothetical protein
MRSLAIFKRDLYFALASRILFSCIVDLLVDGGVDIPSSDILARAAMEKVNFSVKILLSRTFKVPWFKKYFERRNVVPTRESKRKVKCSWRRSYWPFRIEVTFE